MNAKLHDDKEKCSAIISLTDRQLGVIAEDFLENLNTVYQAEFHTVAAAVRHHLKILTCLIGYRIDVGRSGECRVARYI